MMGETSKGSSLTQDSRTVLDRLSRIERNLIAKDTRIQSMLGTIMAQAAEIRSLRVDVDQRETEALDDICPGWRKIVGAVDARQDQPDPDHPFRKWLAIQPRDYQKRIHGSNSAQVIGRAIGAFQAETKGQARSPEPDAEASATPAA